MEVLQPVLLIFHPFSPIFGNIPLGAGAHLYTQEHLFSTIWYSVPRIFRYNHETDTVVFTRQGCNQSASAIPAKAGSLQSY